MTEALYIRSDEIDELAEPADYVAAVREGYREVGQGAPAEPRTQLFNPDDAVGGSISTYVAILPETGAMGGYMYDAGFGAGDAWFLTPLFDAESGEPLAILDGASMNPFKTGATGAVAVDELAREDATELAVIGSGAQARGQAKTTATVRDFERARVFSPTPANREAFADEVGAATGVPFEPVASSAAAVAGADVVITATTATEPVIDADDIEPGTHITAMGQYHPDRRELDGETIAAATYVPDLRARATHDAGAFLGALEEGLITENHIHADLGEVVAGTTPGRTSDDEITVFDSGGSGIETAAAAHMLYERAAERGIGTTLDIAPASEALTG